MQGELGYAFKNQDQINSFGDYLSKSKRASQHTVAAYVTDLYGFVQWIENNGGPWSWNSVSHHEIRTWVIFLLEEENVEPATVNRKLSTLRTFFNYLMRCGILLHNPAASVTSLKTPKRVPQFFEIENMKRLFDDIEFSDDFKGRQDRLMLELMYLTGVRRSELLALNVSDINIEKREIKVLGKRNKERIIPVPQSLATQLQGHITGLNSPHKNSPMFINEKGRRVSETYLYKCATAYLRQVSTLKKVSPHVLRHTFATQMLANGADLNAIKEMLGHANLAATQVYTHTNIDRLRKIHEQAHPRA